MYMHTCYVYTYIYTYIHVHMYIYIYIRIHMRIAALAQDLFWLARGMEFRPKRCRGARGPSRESSIVKVHDGRLKADANGSEMQRDLHALTSLSVSKVVDSKHAFGVYRSMRLLWHDVQPNITPLMQTVIFLAVYVVARQCSSKEHGEQKAHTYMHNLVNAEEIRILFCICIEITSRSLW